MPKCIIHSQIKLRINQSQKSLFFIILMAVPLCNFGAKLSKFGGKMYLKVISIYTAIPVCERPVSVKNSVSEGHFIRFSKCLIEMWCRLLGYEPTTKFQNLRCEKIISLRLKSAKLKKKTYYHAFLRKILAFNLKIIIISEHVYK